MDPKQHEYFTGVSNDLILENLVSLLEEQATVELRIPVVPGINDSMEELDKFRNVLKNILKKVLKIVLLPYHTIADNKYQKLNMKNRMKGLANDTGLSLVDYQKELSSIGFEVKIDV